MDISPKFHGDITCGGYYNFDETRDVIRQERDLALHRFEDKLRAVRVTGESYANLDDELRAIHSLEQALNILEDDKIVAEVRKRAASGWPGTIIMGEPS